MEEKTLGYRVKDYGQPVKRYCQTLELRDDPALVEEYCRRHAAVWPEIKEGIREVGILDMDMYIFGRRVFMIVETALDFDWDSAMARLSTLPRQQEWEDYMSVFQAAEPGQTSAEKWHMMDRIFHLP